MHLILWLIVGAVAGYLASLVVKGHGSGLLVDLVAGGVGGFIGGWLFSALGFTAAGLVGELIMAFVGAVILLWVIRAVTGGYGRRRLI